jgi:hypothetical protein
LSASTTRTPGTTPAGVYQALTGLEKDDATAQDCMALILDRVTAKVQALSRREQSSSITLPTGEIIERHFFCHESAFIKVTFSLMGLREVTPVYASDVVSTPVSSWPTSRTATAVCPSGIPRSSANSA